MVRRTMQCQRLGYLPLERAPFVSKIFLTEQTCFPGYCFKGVWFGCRRFHVLLPSVSRVAHFPDRSEAVPSMSGCCEREVKRLRSRDLLLRAQCNPLSELL